MKRLILVVTLIAVVLTTGCGRRESTEEQAGDKELLLYCGAGIRPPAAELAETFEREHGVKIITNYAGSETLLSTIRLIRSGDLYMPGDKHYVEQAANEDMIHSHKSVCYFIPVILVQKGNPKNIKGLRDLLRPGLKLGLGDPDACAIGRTSYQILARNNIATEDIEKNLAFPSLTVNELGMQIQAKSLDAVIVWNAIAQYYSEHGDEVPIAPEKNVVSTIDIGVLKFTKHRELAEKFVDFISSEQGQNIFKKHNYSTKAPE
ncbi:MAG: molybdate ABC transporter substrate-binding protein [Planctomycetota bacterium]|jgi:molybdate transport system substrate-binding protein